MKKLASLLLALVMLISCVPAMAEEVGTTTQAVVNNTTPHTYDAYQIFAGTQAVDGTALGDVVWGSGVKGAELLEALKTANDYFDTCEDAADVAVILSDGTNDQVEAEALAAFATKYLTTEKTAIGANDNTATLKTGYYLLVDTTTPAEGDAMNAALLQVTNAEITITKKYDVPKVDKAVDQNDVNISDTVTFTLTAQMPSELEGYETYKIIFHDNLSNGLTFTEGTVKVTIDGVDKTAAFTTTHDAGKLTFACPDVLAQGAKVSSLIVVTYDAVLNANAVIGGEGNPNTIKLEYSSNPNWDGTGDTNGDGTPDEPTNTTPEDKVVVFTFELDATKIDGDAKEVTLAGAEFKLYRVTTTTSKDEAGTETTTTTTEYVKVDENNKVTGWTTNEEEATVLTSDAKGLFKVIGLDVGNYFIKETKAPAGYNLLTAPIEFTISSKYTEEEGTWLTNDVLTLSELTITVGEETADGNIENGTVAMNIENKKGATLPETGGMGTTILYVGGGILVLAAIVLLIVKRRASAE